MKVVFPCKGVAVLTKHNVEQIKNFYEETLIDSKLFTAYKQNGLAIQIGSFNYLPENSKIVLDENTHLLTVRELNSVLKKSLEQQGEKEESIGEDDKPLDDEFIKNHPFFQTLAPLE